MLERKVSTMLLLGTLSLSACTSPSPHYITVWEHYKPSREINLQNQRVSVTNKYNTLINQLRRQYRYNPESIPDTIHRIENLCESNTDLRAIFEFYMSKNPRIRMEYERQLKQNP